MNLFPFGRVICMPLTSPSTATPLLSPISIDFPASPIISLYNNNVLLNNPFNLPLVTKFDYHACKQTIPHRFKRLRDDSTDAQHKKRVRSSSTIHEHASTPSKTSLMLLHELKPSIEYKLVAQTGPSHRPIFTMAVEINGQLFEGTAQTKKEAKQAAAEKALRSLNELTVSLSDSTTNKLAPISSKMIRIGTSMMSEDNVPVENIDRLLQLQPDVQFEEITTEQFGHQFIVRFRDQSFVGTHKSKELAKAEAMQLALNNVLSAYPDRKENDNLPYARREFIDHIATRIQEKFNQLTQSDLRFRRRRVLAGIVLTHDYNLETMTIIAITTGTKCSPADTHLRHTGESLSDCHAEILARRCLIHYCYEQLNLLVDGNVSESIFKRIEQTNRFHLKSSVTFHLYISSAPCGDARLFTPNESSLVESKHILRKSCGLLREKLTTGEGTIPVLTKSDSEHFSSMSCSDKLCRWNFIGLQGALLSTFVEPIYFTSIIIGSLYKSEPIRRALFARIEQKIDHMPMPYGLHRPLISSMNNSETRNTNRAPSHSFLWSCIDRNYEIIDNSTRLTMPQESSTISKAALFEQWKNLMKKIQPETIITSYSDAKQLARDYQMAKLEVNNAFEKAGLGTWLKKSSLLSQTNQYIPSNL
ncbi:unnamed protein product [Adineta ricciae]|uniref:Uncharacterized protein n=1 Tax=Adineta ricciae TaxID=249248 RepID=A0A815J4T8_ADIRI|nr:unnamed protein product [Adineta ricciae]CAF1374536.1 unnamed protein product [Adineta ricciae]